MGLYRQLKKRQKKIAVCKSEFIIKEYVLIHHDKDLFRLQGCFTKIFKTYVALKIARPFFSPRIKYARPNQLICMGTIFPQRKYSGDPKTGHVRFSNDRPWFGFQMVRFSNGPKTRWLPYH